MLDLSARAGGPSTLFLTIYEDRSVPRPQSFGDEPIMFRGSEYKDLDGNTLVAIADAARRGDGDPWTIECVGLNHLMPWRQWAWSLLSPHFSGWRKSLLVRWLLR